MKRIIPIIVIITLYLIVANIELSHPTDREYYQSVINCTNNPDLMGCGDKYYY